MRRVIGIDVHRTFGEVVFWENGRLRHAGRIDMTRTALEDQSRMLLVMAHNPTPSGAKLVKLGIVVSRTDGQMNPIRRRQEFNMVHSAFQRISALLRSLRVGQSCRVSRRAALRCPHHKGGSIPPPIQSGTISGSRPGHRLRFRR